MLASHMPVRCNGNKSKRFILNTQDLTASSKVNSSLYLDEIIVPLPHNGEPLHLINIYLSSSSHILDVLFELGLLDIVPLHRYYF
jgi:hypothetical protein